MPLNPTLESIEPWLASQVLVCHNLPSAKSITLYFTCNTSKNAFDRYLTADKYGVVKCTMEAAGPAEAWDIIDLPEGFAFRTLWGTYLTAEPDGTLRADADVIGDEQKFFIKCQAKNRQTTKKKEVKLASAIEVEQLKTRYSFGGKLEKFLTEDSDMLEKAKKKGRLNEELVIRRAAIKNDRYCK